MCLRLRTRQAHKAGDKTLSRALATFQPALQRSTAPQLQGLRSADCIVAVVNARARDQQRGAGAHERVLQAMQAQGAQTIPPRDELAREVLERLIVEKAQVQTAKETGIKADDLAVDQAVAQHGTAKRFEPRKAMRREMAHKASPRSVPRRDPQPVADAASAEPRCRWPRQGQLRHDIDQYMAEQRSQNGQTDMAQRHHQPGPHPDRRARARQPGRSPRNCKPRASKRWKLRARNPDFAAVAKRFSDGGQAVMGMRPAEPLPQLVCPTRRGNPAGGHCVGPFARPRAFTS